MPPRPVSLGVFQLVEELANLRASICVESRADVRRDALSRERPQRGVGREQIRDRDSERRAARVGVTGSAHQGSLIVQGPAPPALISRESFRMASSTLTSIS